jgi:phosphoribosylanthranilate isomerase
MLPGGNGLSFDWTLLADMPLPGPWMLSGGLNAENVTEAVEITNAKMVDVSSGVETAPGQKSLELMEEFLQQVSRC